MRQSAQLSAYFLIDGRKANMEGKQATGECNKKELKRHPVNTVRMKFHHRDKAFLPFLYVRVSLVDVRVSLVEH